MTRSVLITGGAGFIGTNLAYRLARRGERVTIFDNLSRVGVAENLQALRAVHGDRVTVMLGDMHDPEALRRAVAGARRVYHFAAQVAVTTSLTDPAADFAVNAGGTVNLLEALRAQSEPPPLVFASTTKVYGPLDDLALTTDGVRHLPVDMDLRAHGVSEERPLDFHSPYGCSKGAADQYVLDYGRCFGLPATSLRLGCVYGPHQFGTEDQGWLAYFLSRALARQPVRLYGDGRQVRDVLYVDDLVDALLLAGDRIHALKGRPFNVGGGSSNTISLLEAVALIHDLTGRRPDLSYGPVRTGDQAWCVCDIRRFQGATGWTPRVGVAEGMGRLFRWLETRLVAS